MNLHDYNKEPRRVLLMGEDRLSLRVLGSLLAEHGFEIVGEAVTEHAALELLGERTPDVAVLDLHETAEALEPRGRSSSARPPCSRGTNERRAGAARSWTHCSPAPPATFPRNPPRSGWPARVRMAAAGEACVSADAAG